MSRITALEAAYSKTINDSDDKPGIFVLTWCISLVQTNQVIKMTTISWQSYMPGFTVIPEILASTGQCLFIMDVCKPLRVLIVEIRSF